jgi:alkyl-hydroperoxide reductase/thiol specific antioxidant family protein
VKSSQAEFDRRAVSIAVISFAEPAKLIRYQNDHQWPFAIFADPNRSAYNVFRLNRLSWFRVFSPATLRFYFRSVREREQRYRYGTDDIYQGGGDFLIDRDGNILFAYRSRDPADRPPVSRLLQEIDRI